MLMFFFPQCYPMGVVGTAGRGLIIYQLDNTPREFKRIDSPLKYQHRCLSIFKDKQNQPTGNEHRELATFFSQLINSLSLFLFPSGFALGSVEGRVAIQYVNPINPKDNFTFKCHRSNGTNQQGFQDIYAVRIILFYCTFSIYLTEFILSFLLQVNDIKFHPEHGTLATVGSDGRYSFWDKDARTKLKTSEQLEQPITCCAFNGDGQIFAYAVSYDWSKVSCLGLLIFFLWFNRKLIYSCILYL